LKRPRADAKVAAMHIQRLAMGLAIALSVTACNKKDNEAPAPKPADQPAAKAEPVKPAEPPKPEPPKTLSGADLADAYKNCVGLINDKKFDDFAKTCVADEYVGHMGPGMDMKGADTLKGMFAKLTTAFPDHKMEPQLILVSGRTIIGVMRTTGTNDGALAMPGMPTELPATHKKISALFLHRLAINDQNRATEEWAYEDHGTFAGQLGLLPKEAPPHRSADDVKPWDGAPIVAIAADDAKEKANTEATRKAADAFNAHKAGDLMAIMADDVVDSNVADAKDTTGKKACEKGLKDFQAAFSDVKYTLDNVWAAGDYTISSGVIDGTNDHDMGKMKKTGKHVTVPMAEIFQYKDGKVAHIWRFWDSFQFAKQLGLIPDAPAGDKPAGDKAAKPAGTPAPKK
jgi:predicted ester cyclase